MMGLVALEPICIDSCLEKMELGKRCQGVLFHFLGGRHQSQLKGNIFGFTGVLFLGWFFFLLIFWGLFVFFAFLVVFGGFGGCSSFFCWVK